MLLEEAELTSGTTWHAAGLCTQFTGSYNLMGLLKYSLELYRSIEADTGQPVGFHPTGSLRLAQSRDRLDEFAHVAGVAELLDVPFDVVAPARAAELFPLMDPVDLVGAAHLPTDGWIDPTSLANAYAKGATDRGARIHRRAPVTGLERAASGWRLETGAGEVSSRHRRPRCRSVVARARRLRRRDAADRLHAASLRDQRADRRAARRRRHLARPA